MPMRTISRRTALKTAAVAALPLVHIRTAGAAGKVAIGFWDHWVPAGNQAMKQQVDTWAAKNQVEVQADFITTNGGKLGLTAAAEQQARTGHDVLAFAVWDVHNHVDGLEPMDDVMQHLVGQYGPTNQVCEYLARINGHWMAVPSSSGTQFKGPCGRISVLKDKAGLDIVGMYPARPEHTALSDSWTYDAHLAAAEACHKAGLPFGIGLGGTGDSIDTAGSIFAAFGAELVDAKGNITVNSDNVRALLEHMAKLVRFLPDDCVSYDDASNNRALISGKSALIWNPPSAWAVAKRDAIDVAKDCWTFPAPAGPKGRFTPYDPFFWGLWSFSQNKSAAKDLVQYLCERPQVQQRCTTVDGYDIPPFDSMLDFLVWNDVEPPKGTVYNYPLRPFHNALPHVAAMPAPPDLAIQINGRALMPTMSAKLLSGQSIKEVIAWAQDEVEGFMR